MSILTSLGIAAAANTLDTILLRQGRSIGSIIPDCTIEERHKDELEITREPVEQGSPIADHAFKKPAVLQMRVAWSESKSIGAIAQAAYNGDVTLTLNDVYDQLLTLQESVQPISVITGKRAYENMLIVSLQTVTNRETAHVLIIDAVFEQVNIVSTQETTTTALGQASDQANPEKTAEPVSIGQQQLGQPSVSAAAKVKSFLGGLF